KKILGFDRKPLESVQVKLVPCLVWSDTAGEEMRQGTSAEGKALDFRGKNDVYWLDKSYLDDQSVKEELLRNGAAIFLLELDDGEKAGAWLGLRPFSEVVEVEPQYQQENEDITSQLVERYRQRYRAIQVLAHKQKGKVPEPDDISFRAVSKLNLRISYQDEEVAILPVSWWKTDDGSFLVEADKCWLGAGRAIADTTKGKIADVIENLLRASSDEEVLDRLRAQGVAESELQDPNLRVEPSVQKLPPPDKTPSQLQPEKMPDQPQPSSATGAELRPTHTSTQAGSRGRGGWSNQEAQEGGREAEEWLRERLKEILPETWNVSSGSVRDSKGRETDILLRNGEEAVHIEVKHMKSDPQLYWSEREVDKAKKARE
ncbi:MAG: hypothetical protein HY268_34435, partial [Deltaproteobacteria bacterium]|nr:hypothetical protein [Deltaproteobacteria bacterium]